MRVTGPLIKVLSALLEVANVGGEIYGLELSRTTRVKAGTLYPILDRLESAGWLLAHWEEAEPSTLGRPRRRFYSLTGEGVHEARKILGDLGIGSIQWA